MELVGYVHVMSAAKVWLPWTMATSRPTEQASTLFLSLEQ